MQNSMQLIMQFIFWLMLIGSCCGVAVVFVGYPLALLIRAGTIKKAETPQLEDDAPLPRISIITVSHQAGDALTKKLTNIANLDYPKELLEFVFFGDAMREDDMPDMQALLPGIAVKQMSSPTHDGKAAGLNRAAKACTGDILVFSDTDAMLSENSLRALAGHFRNPKIGGVCGMRGIARERGSLCTAQSRYLAFDNMIKMLEAKTSSLTSNEGKLYAIRRDLFKPIDPAATDDLFTCLTVVRAGYRFVFEPTAKMFINSPSRDGGHEVSRRRRVVARSLHGIWQNRELLNPARFGFYSVALFTNKIMRRCIPVFMIAFLIGSIGLATKYTAALNLLLLQAVFYLGVPIAYRFVRNRQPKSAITRKLHKIIALPTYFLLGNLGTLMGMFDFLSGRRVTKWKPIK